MKKAGQIIYAIVMAIFGIFHFANGGNMTGFVPSWLPAPKFWVYLVGLALIAAAVSIIINKKASLATLLLGIMLVIFVLAIHLPGALGSDQAAAQLSSTMLLKDLALAGAAFFMSGVFKAEES